MNLKDAQTLERSMRGRAGSMQDLSRGRTTRRMHYDPEILELSEHMRNELRETASRMHNTAGRLRSVIDEALKNITVDI